MGRGPRRAAAGGGRRHAVEGLGEEGVGGQAAEQTPRGRRRKRRIGQRWRQRQRARSEGPDAGGDGGLGGLGAGDGPRGLRLGLAGCGGPTHVLARPHAQARRGAGDAGVGLWPRRHRHVLLAGALPLRRRAGPARGRSQKAGTPGVFGAAVRVHDRQQLDAIESMVLLHEAEPLRACRLDGGAELIRAGGRDDGSASLFPLLELHLADELVALRPRR
mmetsp:Transcript_96863/g.278167  ORF Transcript_96863/g.278167 Transcript_96863/m.278167 type:complete len:218 (+) Transcript_96863:157-810(+)